MVDGARDGTASAVILVMRGKGLGGSCCSLSPPLLESFCWRSAHSVTKRRHHDVALDNKRVKSYFDSRGAFVGPHRERSDLDGHYHSQQMIRSPSLWARKNAIAVLLHRVA